MSGRKVLVCGGRSYENRAEVFSTLDGVHSVDEIVLVVHGACSEKTKHGIRRLRGADRWAQEWAITREVPYFGWPAPFSKMGGPGGPWRNGKMLARWEPDLVIAFPGGKGTASMISKARNAGVNVMIVDSEASPLASVGEG